MNHYKIALIGLPNVGKTTFLNSISDSSFKIANFPGSTIEIQKAEIQFSQHKYTFYDLPGLYSLEPVSFDEKITRDAIFSRGVFKDKKIDHYFLLIGEPLKSLYLLSMICDLQKDYNFPVTVVLNKGLGNDEKIVNGFKNFLTPFKINVVLVDFKSKSEVLLLFQESLDFNHKPCEIINIPNYQDVNRIKSFLDTVDSWKKTLGLNQSNFLGHSHFKIDQYLLHPFYGILFLLIIFILIFQILFFGADPLMNVIELIFSFVSKYLENFIDEGLLLSLLQDGVLGGVGGVLVFVPHILMMFLLIGILERSGYMSRIAYLLDFIMRKAGLPGKAIIPLLSSHACAIPGIMATRIISNPLERFITIMISPLMTCSARLPVYILLTAALTSDKSKFSVAGMELNGGGILFTGVYIFSILVSFVVAIVLKYFYKNNKELNPPSASVHKLLLELPPYQVPPLMEIFWSALDKSLLFIKKAGTIIVFFSVLMWGLTTFPVKKDEDDTSRRSFAESIGRFFDPVFNPIGFDWKITTALLPSFAAREVMVSSLATVLSVENDDSEKLSQVLRNEYSIATLLSLMVWFIFAPQCISTFAVIRKETKRISFALFFGIYSLALAYFFSFITFNIVNLII